MKEIKMPIRNRIALFTTHIKGRDAIIFMAPIDNNDEAKLANQYTLVLNNDKIFYKDVYLFGKVNIDDSDDIRHIRALPFTDISKGCIIPNNYDYNNHTVTVEDNAQRIPHRETFDVLNVFKYCYNTINRPKRVVVYAVDKLMFNHVLYEK